MCTVRNNVPKTEENITEQPAPAETDTATGATAASVVETSQPSKTLEDSLFDAIVKLREGVIKDGLDEQTVKAWPAWRVMRQFYGHR